ncbi:MAG TPA: hypothetical protein VLB45_00205 [Nitrosopumilaceae archaeon]|nr:hypothetical protein [Nitrosopumilaceae archaeon]
MRRQSRHSKRGLSTVVVSGILIAAVAIMGSAVVSWSNSNMMTRQQSLETTYVTNVNKIKEYLAIENIWFGGTTPANKFVNMTFSNAGSIGLNITETKLVTSTSTAEFSYTNGGIFPSKINSTQRTYNWQDDVPIDVIVTTARGSIFRTQVTP